jgi:hypothetical protein
MMEPLSFSTWIYSIFALRFSKNSDISVAARACSGT